MPQPPRTQPQPRTLLQPGRSAPPNTARIADGFGTIEKKLPGSASFRPLSTGDRVPVATVLRTGADAALLVELPSKHMVRVGAGSTVVLSQLGQGGEYTLRVLTGQVWALVQKASHPRKFTVETSSGVAGVTGTLFAVGVEEETQEMVVSTSEGSVEVQAYDESGGLVGQPVPVTQGMMLRAAWKRVQQLIALRQAQEHVLMWRLLAREGAWARQQGQGTLRLTQGREKELLRYLHQRVSAPSERPQVPNRPLPGRLRQKTGNKRS